MPTDDNIRLIHIHQDQVETLPPGAQLIGSNGFCPHAMFVIGDNVLCVQGHPEFTIAYIDQLMQVRADVFDPETLEAAQATLITAMTVSVLPAGSYPFWTHISTARRLPDTARGGCDACF